MAAALSSANASMITGARGSFAVGEAVSALRALGIWRSTAPDDSGTPRRALIVQAAISLILVAFGAAARAGFETMVAYTAPVFWLTLLLMGVALFVLRRREPDRERPFRVPLYPLTPLLFCLTSAGMLYSSVAYAGRGALLGVAVMLAGLPLLLIGRSRVAPADPSLGSVETTP
jgi:amino acid transporter